MSTQALRDLTREALDAREFAAEHAVAGSADPANSAPHALSHPHSRSHTGATATQRLVLRVQLCVLACAFVIAFVLGAMAPAKGSVRAPMALPEWNDAVQPWQVEVDAFAGRISAGFGVRHSVALEFSPWILEASRRQQLAPELLAGLVLTESTFRKQVTSSVGAVGPAQVRPDYWAQFCGTSDLLDPAENIYCGAQILAYYKERCGAEACALAAYNIGPYSAKRRAGERYVAKVGRWRQVLEVGLDQPPVNEHLAVQAL